MVGDASERRAPDSLWGYNRWVGGGTNGRSSAADFRDGPDGLASAWTSCKATVQYEPSC